MSIRFEDVCLAQVRDLSLSFENGTVAGLVGADGAGKGLLLRLAAGLLHPERGRVESTAERILVEAGPRAREELAAAWAANPSVLLIDHALGMLDSAALIQCVQALDRLRRRGAVLMISSHDLLLLERVCDVVVALEEGRVIEPGDPGLVLAGYRKRMAARGQRARGAAVLPPLARYGDGRAEVTSLQILGENGAPASTVRSGEQVTVVATLRFLETVEHPAAGILVRNRIGVTVYGTNTEMEQAPI